MKKIKSTIPARHANTGMRLVTSSWPILLAVIGTVLLAYASVLQLTKIPDTAEERSRLQRSQLVVDLAEGQRDQWLIALNQEQTREHPNPAMLGVTALEYIETTERWRSYLALRSADSQEAHDSAINKRNNAIAAAKQRYDDNDVAGLLKQAHALKEAISRNNEIEQSDSQFAAETDQVNSDNSRINRRTTFCFIFGSALMIVSTAVSSLQTTRSLMKLEARLG